MDLKGRRNRSLNRGRCPKDPHYNTSSLDTDECRVPTQKSYSSSETLKAFDHEQRLHYGGCVTDLVHHEADEYSRQGVLEFSPVFMRYLVSGTTRLRRVVVNHRLQPPSRAYSRVLIYVFRS
ncbi:teneurin-2 [Gadus macrocephalus]|uniref:teneurin-2 n=1 Tax=Gadus macrocephalus TaxID=80720 RepID=UPI0028CB1821|nr:teneurin-2 [Gadus macrocephalus]